MQIKNMLEPRTELTPPELLRAVNLLAGWLLAYSEQFDYDNADFNDAIKIVRELMGFPDD